jgi:hypothetical protein
MRSTVKLLPFAAVMLTGLLFATTASATPPSNYYVEYKSHEDPADEESPVIFMTRFYLEPVSTNGTSVGWEVARVEFFRIDGDGHATVRWQVNFPEVDSMDGLWWVEHEHESEPAAEEFFSAPSIAGDATRMTSSGAALAFQIEAGTLAYGQQSLYAGKVAALSYTYHEYGASDPDVDDDDEPAEVGGSSGNPQQ